jgi:enamine deaminase RidA (YjgF/YER057c/UK114 family)
MGRIDDRLAELGLELPQPFAAPPGVEFKFDLVRVSGALAYVSGHGPVDSDRTLAAGKVGADVSLEDAAEAARLTGLAIVSSLRATLGDLDRVTGWARAFGMVNCAPGFNQTPAVINGFSGLVLEVWGPEAGRHARSAIGVAELPFDWPVEIEAVVELGEPGR